MEHASPFSLRSLFVPGLVLAVWSSSPVQAQFGPSPWTVPSSGTYTVPPNVTSVRIECWGGGGGGGGAAGGSLNSTGKGGGGGAYARIDSLPVVPGEALTITVGSGGTGANGANGGAGGNSSVTYNGTTVVSAAGGGGGSTATGNNTGAAGNGGQASSSIGDVRHDGGNGGGGGFGGGGGGGGSAWANGPGGNGGNAGSTTGAGAGSGGTSGTGGGYGGNGGPYAVNNGSPGTTPGGGGGGAKSDAGQAARSGGAGGAGRVIITYTVCTPLNAGNDATVTLCTYDAPADLFTLLGDSAQAGGTWSGPSTLSGGLFDPATMTAGSYTYTIPGVAPCPSATATVTVIVDPCLGVEELNGPAVARWLGQEGARHVVDVTGTTVSGWEVSDATGRTVSTSFGTATGSRLYIPMEGRAPGVHIIRLFTTRGPLVLRVVHTAK